MLIPGILKGMCYVNKKSARKGDQSYQRGEGQLWPSLRALKIDLTEKVHFEPKVR